MGAVKLDFSQQFETIECCKCGVVFAVAGSLNRQWRKTTQTFHCPNGHPQSYRESEADRIKRELTAQLEAAQRDAEWQRVGRNDAIKRERAMKGQITKLKKRIGAGVCPCCHRTFKQLASHMAGQHPDYTHEETSS